MEQSRVELHTHFLNGEIFEMGIAIAVVWAVRKAFVILNTAAGTLVKTDAGKSADEIHAACAARGVTCEIREVDGPGVSAALDEALASDCDVVVAGGGDGTLNSIASALVGTDKIFAILQLGTLNHLAKELRMPSDLTEAVNALIDGDIAPLPIGRVNDQHFLLFSAMGLYAQVVKHRDAQRRSLGRRKWPAMAIAFFRLLKRFRLWRVHLTIDGKLLKRYTPTVYIAVSGYQESLMGLENKAFPAGRSTLRVHIAPAVGRLALVGLLLRAAFGRLRPAKDFETIEADSFELTVAGQAVRVGIDGEIVDLEPPLKYQLLAAGLTILRPKAPAVAA